MRKKVRQPTYWTKARVLEGLRLFYLHHKFTPLDTHSYQRIVKGTGKRHERAYPSFYGVLRWFHSFRAAWEAAGITVSRDWEPWSPLEDWYLREAAGLISRADIARDLRRTPGAVHRRLYDLGVNSRTQHGWSSNHLSRVAQIPEAVVRTYMERGELPYMKGSVCNFMDPADFLVITQIDWDNPPAELAEAVRRSLVCRMIRLILRQDWRAGRPYKAHCLRTTNKRWRGEWIRPIPNTSRIKAGDWVRCKQAVRYRPYVEGRVGKVHLVYWSRNAMRAGHSAKSGSARPQAEPCWMARVEFQKLRRHGNDLKRVTYTLPLSALARLRGEPA